MRIGIDASRAVTARRTGTEAYAYFLIRSLMPLAAQSGHRLRLYFNQSPPPEFFPQADHVEDCVIPFPRLWTHLRLGWELTRRPPDVFFTPAHVVPRSYRGVSVATVHDLGYLRFPEAHPEKQRRYLDWSTRHNTAVSRRVIADSETTKMDLIHFYGVGAAKIDVIYPAADPALKQVIDRAAITAVLEKYAIAPPYFLYIGTLQPRKNLTRLVQAYRQSGVRCQLALAGNAGWLAQPILDEIAAAQTTLENGRPAIVMPGFIDDADKAALLSGATALLFPSLHEGFGFPVLEAQACGTPVLTANSSSLPEAAGNGALFVNPLDVDKMATAVYRLSTDPLLRAELVEKGFENARGFRWEETAARVLRTLEDAAGQR